MGIYESVAKILRNPTAWHKEDAKDTKEQDRLFLGKCQGEAAQLLLCALMVRFDASYNPHVGSAVTGLDTYYPTYDGIFRIHIKQQTEGKTETVSPKTNLVIELTRWWKDAEEQPVFGSLHIEIVEDEAEPQVPYEVVTAGFEKFARFSASHIIENPFNQAEQVHFMLDEIAATVFKSYLSTGRLVELIIGPVDGS